MCDQRRKVELRPLPDHSISRRMRSLPPGTERRHDAVIAEACRESVVGDLQLAGIDAEA